MRKDRHTKKHTHDLSERKESEVDCMKDDFDGALGKLVDKITKGWMGSEGGVYEVSLIDNHFRFLSRNGLAIAPNSESAAEFSGKYPRIVAIGSNLNIQTHGPLNAQQAVWLTTKLEEGRIKNIITETGRDHSSVQVNLLELSSAEAIMKIQDYLITP